MKRAILAGLLLIGIGRAWAYEIPENPDKRISFGFNFDRYDMKGDYDLGARPTFGKDFGTLIQQHFKGDVRIPVFSFLTLSAGGGYSTTAMGLGLISNDERWNLHGYSVNAGFRIYIP